MSVFRINKTKDYTVMSNTHLRDMALSLRAKGLLSVMLSLPEDWDYSINGLAVITDESEGKIKASLDELKENGYLEVTKLMQNDTPSGRIEYVYDVYEMPKQEGKKQGVEKQGLVFQGLENTHLNKITNKVNTNLQITNKNKDAFGSAEMQSAFNDWLSYKTERREGYKPTGLQALITRLQNDVRQHGESKVIEAIRYSMAQGWKGIYYPKNDAKTEQSNPASYDINRAEQRAKTGVPKLVKRER